MTQHDNPWGTHEGVMELFSGAVMQDGVAFTLHKSQAEAVVAVWDSEFNDYVVSRECWPVYKHLSRKPFLVPHAAVVDKQVRRLAKKGGDPLNVTKYFAVAVLALREAGFQEQVRFHQRDRLGGEE